MAKIFLKKGVAVIFVDNFAGRHVINTGADQCKYQLIHIILMHMTLEYLSKDPRVN